MKKLGLLVSLIALLMIGSSALAGWTEDFEANPNIAASPWGSYWGPASLGPPNAPNPSNVSMNHTDFTAQTLDLVAIGESAGIGYVEFDMYHGVGWNRIHVRNAGGWNMVWLHIWGNGGAPDYEVAFMDSIYVPNHQALDVIAPSTWNRFRIDWDAPNQLISLAVNGVPVPGMQNVPGMEPGHNYSGDVATRIDFVDYSGTAPDPMQIDNIGVNAPAPAPMIPEPVTLALLGLGGMFLRRRKA